MHRLVLLATVVFTAKSAAIHNQQSQDHQTLYSQLHAQQQQQQQHHDSLITPLKLQYVAPKAFLTSAGLVSGQQVLTTANPQVIQTANMQALSPSSPRHLSMVNSQQMSPNTESVSAKNLQLYPTENSQYFQNVQRLPAVNQQIVTTPNPQLILQRSPQQMQSTNSDLLSLVNQLIASSELISSRNPQNIGPQYVTSTVNPQQSVENQQIFSASQLVSPRNPQHSNPQYLTPTINPQQSIENQQIYQGNQFISPRNPQFISAVSPQQPDSQLVPQQNIAQTGAPGVPLIYTVQSPVENYSGQQRYNRLPATNNILPELQFADPRANRIIIPNSQISSLLHALYQPSYLLMAMPPTSYTSVSYYDDNENNNQDQDINAVQSDSPQLERNENDDSVQSKSNVIQRSNSDAISESDSSGDFPETANDVLNVSYKDNHVKYSY